MKVSKLNGEMIGIGLITLIFLFIGVQGYRNFQDHRNIFPKKSQPEYVFKCPKCGHITENTYRRCRSCNELTFYRNIKIKNETNND